MTIASGNVFARWAEHVTGELKAEMDGMSIGEMEYAFYRDLAFGTGGLRGVIGICMTATHNPAEYNGYKVYGLDGCQITIEAARAIQAAIDAVDAFDDVRQAPFGMKRGDRLPVSLRFVVL